jgi:integrase
MPVRRNCRGKWFYRKKVKLPDGKRVDISGTPSRNTKEAAEQAERAHIDRVLKPESVPVKKEVPTYEEWFWGPDASAPEPNGLFWTQWVVGNKNKPSECLTKVSIFQNHLRTFFGQMRLDRISANKVADFRARLVAADLSEKRINNICAVLSKSMRWAEECELIERAPRIRFYRVEQPEIEFYDFGEYARLLEAAAKIGARWYAGVCLAGEAGLRVGEVKAIRWREDIDLVARTVTVNQQVLRGVFGTPKGRTRRTIPMTDRLYRALKAISTVREGLLLRRADGGALTDSHAHELLYRTCRGAGLPERGWHVLRHSLATHAAMFGINPWLLQVWLGHKSLTQTQHYTHVAENHRLEIPENIRQAGESDADLTKRVLAMLSARGDFRCIPVASPRVPKEELQANPLFI